MARNGGSGAKAANGGGEVHGSSWRTKLGTRIISCIVTVALVFMVPLPAFAEQTGASAQASTADTAAVEQAAQATATEAQAVSTEAGDIASTAETASVQDAASATAGDEAELDGVVTRTVVTVIEFGVKVVCKAAKYHKNQDAAEEISGNIYIDEDCTLPPLIVAGDTRLIIMDGVTVTIDATEYGNYAAIRSSNKDYNLTITPGAITPEDGSEPVIEGTGKLVLTGGKGSAAIGGHDENSNHDCYNVTIEGCTIEAQGGTFAAGIGGGNKGNLQNFTVNGGTVIAKAGGNAAGIGGGERSYSTSNNITINGGTVKAYGGPGSAGIGGGITGSACNITINENIQGVSTEVYAEGANGGAGIGGGMGYCNYPHGHDITINGGTVTAIGARHNASQGGAGIGSGSGQETWNITINGGNVTAEGHGSAAGIGGGSEGKARTIAINGGTVNASSVADGTDGGMGAGIGSGRNANAMEISISGGTVTATSAYDGAGIGSGAKGELKKDKYGIKISGGSITAMSRRDGAGIGSGAEKKAENIEISGKDTKVVATSRENGAGIGSGAKGEAKDITVNEGTVTTNALVDESGAVTEYVNFRGAGIGSGREGKADGLFINGGNLDLHGGTTAGENEVKACAFGQGMKSKNYDNNKTRYISSSVKVSTSDDGVTYTDQGSGPGSLTSTTYTNCWLKTDNGITGKISIEPETETFPAYGTSTDSDSATNIFVISTSYVSDTNWTIQWYKDGTSTDAPADFSVYTNGGKRYLKLVYTGKGDAGDYTFTLSCGGATSDPVSYTVNKASAAITSGSATKVYDGTPLTCESSETSGFIEGEGVDVTCTGSQTETGSSDNAFTYEPQAGTNLDNYAITETKGKLTVVDQLFVVTGENYSGVYDGADHAFGVKVTGKNGIDYTSVATLTYATSTTGEDGSWSGWTDTVPSVKGVGKMYVKVQASATVHGQEKTIESDVYTMEVTKRNLTLTSDSATKEYDGSPLTATKVTADGFVTGEGASYVEFASLTKAGSTENTFEPKYSESTDFSNYNVTKVVGTLTVTPKSTPITIATNSSSKTYDGNAIDAGTATWTDGVLENGDKIAVTLEHEGDGAVQDAGTYSNAIDSYTVTRDGEDVTNCYTFAEPNIGTLTIVPCAITMTSGSALVVYSDDTPVAQNKNVTVTGDLVEGQVPAYTTDSFPTVTATDLYKVTDNTFTYADSDTFKASNYAITQEYGKLMLVEKLGIMASDVSFVYDGTAHQAGAQAAGGTGGAAVQISYSTSTDNETWSAYTTTIPTIKNAGVLYIKAKATKGDQTAEASYTATVNKRGVELITQSASKAYDGTALTTADSGVIVSGYGFAQGEGATFHVTGTQTLVGESENSFTYMLSGKTDADNYAITERPGTLSVTENAQVVRIETASDTQAYNGMSLTNTDWTATFGGAKVENGALCAGDTLTVLPSGSITEVGTARNGCEYQVLSAAGQDVTSCYTFGEVTEGTLEVTPRSITIATGSAEKVYDGTALTYDKYTVTGDGFVGDDGFATVTVAGTRTNAGTAENLLDSTMPYTFKDGTNAKNYTVTVDPGTLTVSKRKVTVTSGSAVSTYEACSAEGLSNNAACTVTGDGFVSGEMESGYPQGDGKLTKPVSEPEEGSPVTADNTIKYSWVRNGNPANYEITECLGKLMVTSNSASKVFASDYVGVYDGVGHLSEYASTLPADATATYTVDGVSGLTADQAKAKMTDVKRNGDGTVLSYSVGLAVSKGDASAECSYTVTINPRELALTAGSAEKVYDGTALTCADYTVGGDGFANETEKTDANVRTEGAITDFAAGGASNVITELTSSGSFKISNYDIAYIPGSLTIDKRPVVLVSKALGLTPQSADLASATEDAALAEAYELAELSGSEIGDPVCYDGEAHTQTAVIEVGNTKHGGLKDIEGMGFVGDEGMDYDGFTEATDAGLYRNKFNAEFKTNTKEANYTVKYLYGTMKISPREVVLVSASASKAYDGTPLVKEIVAEGGDGFIGSQGVTCEVTGSQTTVGSSANTFTYELMANTSEANYTITAVEGVLEVTASDRLRVVVPEDQVFTYDGEPHGDAATAVVGTEETDARIWYSTDGGQTWTGQVPQLTDPGTLNVLVYAEKDNYEPSAQDSYILRVVSGESVELGGADRYETCAKIVAEAYPDGAEGVIIATGENFPDALAAASLAGVLDWPIVITRPESLSANAVATINNLGATRAIVVGGEAAVSATTFGQLQTKLGPANVERVAGADRCATADAIYAKGCELGAAWSGTAVIATGMNFADALSFSNYSAKSQTPIFLVSQNGELTAATKKAIANDGFSKVYVLGGQAAVPTSVDAWLNANVPDANAERLGGSDRYVTSKLIADAYIALNGGANGACVATGERFPDALVGGVLAAKTDSVLLLASDANIVSFASIRTYVKETGSPLSKLYVFGGEDAVSADVRSAATAAVFGEADAE